MLKFLDPRAPEFKVLGPWGPQNGREGGLLSHDTGGEGTAGTAMTVLVFEGQQMAFA